MDKLFFFVTSSEAWKSDTSHFHDNFFVTNGGFTSGLIAALVVAIACAMAFYFGCANNKRSVKYASTGVWAGFMAGAFGITFLIASLVFIGKSSSTSPSSPLYKFSFYKANTEYLIKQTSNNPNQQLVQKLNTDKQTIQSNLDKNKDVRMPYSFSCAVYALLFFYLISLCIKGFTISGIAIPHLWPNKKS